MRTLIQILADNRRPNSLAVRMRRKRFLLFENFIAELKEPITILDVGGTVLFWDQMRFTNKHNIRLTLLNKTREITHRKNFVTIQGDARKMDRFADLSFDVAFSNSVIEHLETWEAQLAMAREMQRVAKRIFLQTPNYYFPVEPHFLFPFFQFFPLGLKTWMLQNIKLGWYGRIPDKQRARELCSEIRLLSRKELKMLFPGCRIITERFLGLPKSFIVMCSA